jgi:endonuclease/exonuclease/phosphatase (EEP) superfamily protein YafD
MRSARAAALLAISVALIATAAAVVAALLAPLGWPFELFAHFRWQFGAASMALLLAALVARRPWLIAIAGVTVILPWVAAAVDGAMTRAPRDQGAIAAPAAAACSGVELRVVTANALFTNAEPALLLDWLQHIDADVVALQEITPAWAVALQPLAAKYLYSKVLAREDPYGIALLSRWPVRDLQAIDFAGDGLPALVARIDVRGHEVQVIALHTRWPVLPGLQAMRDRALQRAAAVAADQPAATILLGDLNLTPYAPAFGRLVAESGLRDAFDDQAWRPTWQAGFWPLALPLDHVLVPRGSCVLGHQIGPAVGSDHRPLQVTLRLP